MKKNILFITFVLLQLFTNTLSAQYQHKRNISSTDWKNIYAYSCQECQKNAEFVFEGKVIASKYYPSDSTYDRILFSSIIKITKVFKGNLKFGNIEFISKVPSGLVMLKGTPNGTYEKKDDLCSNIFFCNLSNHKHDSNNEGFTVENKIIIESCMEYEIHDYKCKDANSKGISGFDTTFLSKASLYNYLRTEYHISISKSAEEKGDTTSSPYYYHNYIDWYKETILHQKVPTLMERIAMQEKRFHYVNDSLDSVESYKYMLNFKTEVNTRNRAEKSPFRFDIYWDGNLRRYSGESVDTTKNKPRRNGFENN